MNNEVQWTTPTPLRPDGTNLLPFPVNALPPIIGDMAQAIATTTSTDVAMAGTSMKQTCIDSKSVDIVLENEVTGVRQ